MQVANIHAMHAINEWRQEEILAFAEQRSTYRQSGGIRKIRGQILQEELRAYLNVTQGHLSKIERGKTAPSLEMLILLSERFYKGVDWILRGEGH